MIFNMVFKVNDLDSISKELTAACGEQTTSDLRLRDYDGLSC